jgi:hypothetical protein
VPQELEQAATAATDPEVQRRAQLIVKHIRKGQPSPLDRVIADGPLDELIDRVVLAKSQLSWA